MSYISIYNYSITGDCSNTSSGELFFEVTGDSPNWVVSEISGSGLLPTTILTPGSNSYYVNGLPPGNYVFQVIESTIPPTSIQDTTGIVIEEGRMVVSGAIQNSIYD